MATAPQQPSTARSIAGLIVFLIIIGSIVYSCNNNANGSTEDADPSGGGDMAELICEDFVTERLKAPSTAEFPGADSVTELKTDTYLVSASVDSENGFGAMIRTAYECTVVYVSDDKWSLVSLNMDE